MIISNAIEYLARGPASESNSKRNRLVTILFSTHFLIKLIQAMLVPIKNSLLFPFGTSLQAGIMVSAPFITIVAQFLIAASSTRFGPGNTLIAFFYLSTTIMIFLSTSLYCYNGAQIYAITLLGFFSSIFGPISNSLFWSFLVDALSSELLDSVGVISGGGTAGRTLGAVLLSLASPFVGIEFQFFMLSIVSGISAFLIHTTLANGNYFPIIKTNIQEESSTKLNETKNTSNDLFSTLYSAISKLFEYCSNILNIFYKELISNVNTCCSLWTIPLLRYVFLYGFLWSLSNAFLALEKGNSARMMGISKEVYAGSLGSYRVFQSGMQFLVEMLAAR